MNEQEVDVWTKRLQRVWRLGAHSMPTFTYGYFRIEEEVGLDTIGPLYFKCRQRSETSNAFSLHFWRGGVGNMGILGYLRASTDRNDVIIGEGLNEWQETHYAQFAQRYLPYFRCNCWLSGCPIDASNHEKMEWLRTITPDELDAWKLKV